MALGLVRSLLRLGRTVYWYDNVLATLLTNNVATLHFDR